jgi:hypothetical protein
VSHCCIFIYLTVCSCQGRYNPGDIVIFRSPYLFHAISPWTPGPLLPEHTCTPGRVSWVYFSHADVVNVLADKKEGWFAEGGWTSDIKMKG